MLGQFTAYSMFGQVGWQTGGDAQPGSPNYNPYSNYANQAPRTQNRDTVDDASVANTKMGARVTKGSDAASQNLDVIKSKAS